MHEMLWNIYVDDMIDSFLKMPVVNTLSLLTNLGSPAP